MIFVWKALKKTKGHTPEDADLWSGKDVIDRDEEEWKAKEAADRANGKDGGWWYRHTVGYIF